MQQPPRRDTRLQIPIALLDFRAAQTSERGRILTGRNRWRYATPTSNRDDDNEDDEDEVDEVDDDDDDDEDRRRDKHVDNPALFARILSFAAHDSATTDDREREHTTFS